MVARCLPDNHPPLYFVVAKLAYDLFGDAPWALRLPSALLGAAVVPSRRQRRRRWRIAARVAGGVVRRTVALPRPPRAGCTHVCAGRDARRRWCPRIRTPPRVASCGTFETRGIRIYCVEQTAAAAARPGESDDGQRTDVRSGSGPGWRSKRCARRPPDRVGVQRQVAADPRTVHATAALARHALPVCRVMALAAGSPPGGGALRQSFHRVVPFLVRKTNRRTWSGA